MNYSIIIPNLNGEKFLEDCLSSLKKSINNTPNSTFEIILVDNGSTDNSLNTFTSLTRGLSTSIINNPSNFGFAKAVNQGIVNSKYDYVCLMNNDLTINPDWFSLVDKNIKDSDSNTAVFAGTVLTKDGKFFESQGLDFQYSGKCQNVLNGKPVDNSEIDKPVRNIWGSSAAMVVYKKSVLETIGLFDEDFIAYEEDVDVALRLHKLGYKTLLIPNAVSYHLGSGTSNRMGNFRNIHDAKNWIYIILKNYSSKEIISNAGGIVEERLRNFSGLFKSTLGSYGLKSFYLFPYSVHQAYFPIISGLGRILNKRSQYQKLLQSRNDNRH